MSCLRKRYSASYSEAAASPSRRIGESAASLPRVFRFEDEAFEISGPNMILDHEIEAHERNRKIIHKMRVRRNIEKRRLMYARQASSRRFASLCNCWTMGPRYSWVVQDIIEGLETGEADKLQLWENYVKLVEQYETDARRASWWLYHLQALRTTFNIILPAILALQNVGSLTIMIMWLTWGLSLAVSLATGYLDLFRLREMYEMMTRAHEYLKLEGWQFFALIGKYGSYRTHQLALNPFLLRIAKLKKRMLDQQFPPQKVVNSQEVVPMRDHHQPIQAFSQNQNFSAAYNNSSAASYKNSDAGGVGQPSPPRNAFVRPRSTVSEGQVADKKRQQQAHHDHHPSAFTQHHQRPLKGFLHIPTAEHKSQSGRTTPQTVREMMAAGFLAGKEANREQQVARVAQSEDIRTLSSHQLRTLPASHSPPTHSSPPPLTEIALAIHDAQEEGSSSFSGFFNSSSSSAPPKTSAPSARPRKDSDLDTESTSNETRIV